MADIEIPIDAGTSKRLLTAGKYCDKNILVTASGSGGGSQNDFGLSIPIDIFWKKLFDPSKIIFSMTTFFIFLAPIMLKSDNVQVSLYDFDKFQGWENQNIDTSMLPAYYQAIKTTIESSQVSSPSELSTATISELLDYTQAIYSPLSFTPSISDDMWKLRDGDTDVIVVNAIK